MARARTRKLRPAGMSILTLGMVVAVAAGVHGCRTLATLDYEGAGTLEAGPESPVASTSFTERPSGLLVGSLTETGSIDAAEFWPSGPSADRFLLRMADADETQAVTRTITLDGEKLAEITRVRSTTSAEGGQAPEADGSEGEGETARTVIGRTSEGGIAIAMNDADGIRSTFEPPAVYLPPTLSAGETVTMPFTVQSEGTRFGTGKGEGSVTVRGIGDQRLRTPAGDFGAFVVERESAFSIGPAKIERKSRLWFATPKSHADSSDMSPSNRGLLAEEGSQSVKVFGLNVSTRSWVTVLQAIGQE